MAAVALRSRSRTAFTSSFPSALQRAATPLTAARVHRISTATIWKLPRDLEQQRHRYTTSASSKPDPASLSSHSSEDSMADLTPNSAPGVSLSDQQSRIVSSVLGLFAGQASPEKLKLWAEDGVFEDPLTVSTGRTQFEAQWYGLKSICSKIEIQKHTVTSAGNPIVLDLDNNYTLKGVGTEQKVSSKVEIYTTPDGSIGKVRDLWNGNLPDNPVANALRKLNANVVPKIISKPQTTDSNTT